jgi:ornithine decarboxylase
MTTIDCSGQYRDAAAVVSELAPDDPYFCVRPQVLANNARHFVSSFPGHVLYAVKCNHDPLVLKALWDGGIRHFDTASIAEIRRVKTLFPSANCYFMHPVKSREAIREAFLTWGIDTFVVDHPDELSKIVEEIGGLSSLRIMVRLATRLGAAVYDLGGKFGATVPEAAALLKSAASMGARVGLSFHVGSQCLEAAPWFDALDLVCETVSLSGVTLDVLDVGGGYPTPYVGLGAHDFSYFADAVGARLKKIDLSPNCQIWCEPGRALVANGASLLTRIQLRRDQQLYLNDGFYGSLSFINIEKLHPPLRLIRADGKTSDAPLNNGFSFFGPTCDSIDKWSGPNYALPDDCREGDWVEFGNAGAYSIALAGPFNGFNCQKIVTVDDDGTWERSQMPDRNALKAAE